MRQLRYAYVLFHDTRCYLHTLDIVTDDAAAAPLIFRARLPRYCRSAEATPRRCLPPLPTLTFSPRIAGCCRFRCFRYADVATPIFA